jgi:hypothetical protein
MHMDKMRPLVVVLIVLTALGLSSCTRNLGSSVPSPEATDPLSYLLNSPTATNDYTRNTNTPTPEEVEATEVEDAGGGDDDDPQTTEAPAPTDPQATATLHVITPTSAPAATGAPENTSAAPPPPTPTFTPVVLGPPDLNPETRFNGRHYLDSFDDPQPWYDMSGLLPDSRYLNLEVLDGQMHVTGKLGEWETWWLSGYTLYDYYIEMEVETNDCEDNDAYGLMVRASQHDEPTRGYIFGMTCDGKVYAKRLITADPFVAVSILNPTESHLINSGANQTNILGVWVEDNTLEIYINHYYFTVIYDDTFGWGRYGVYVKAGGESDYTYTANRIEVWEVLPEE